MAIGDGEDFRDGLVGFYELSVAFAGALGGLC